MVILVLHHEFANSCQDAAPSKVDVVDGMVTSQAKQPHSKTPSIRSIKPLRHRLCDRNPNFLHQIQCISLLESACSGCSVYNGAIQIQKLSPHASASSAFCKRRIRLAWVSGGLAVMNSRSEGLIRHLVVSMASPNLARRDEEKRKISNEQQMGHLRVFSIQFSLYSGVDRGSAIQGSCVRSGSVLMKALFVSYEEAMPTMGGGGWMQSKPWYPTPTRIGQQDLGV